MFTWDPKWNLPKMTFSPTIKKILYKSIFIAGEMKWNFDSRVVQEKRSDSVKANHFCFDEIKAWADVFFHMISFRVVFTWSFINRNEILFLSKWSQWNNNRNEFHFGLYHVNSYKKLTRHRNENISFRPRWNLM